MYTKSTSHPAPPHFRRFASAVPACQARPSPGILQQMRPEAPACRGPFERAWASRNSNRPQRRRDRRRPPGDRESNRAISAPETARDAPSLVPR
jgi:hypothetical protein